MTTTAIRRRRTMLVRPFDFDPKRTSKKTVFQRLVTMPANHFECHYARPYQITPFRIEICGAVCGNSSTLFHVFDVFDHWIDAHFCTKKNFGAVVLTLIMTTRILLGIALLYFM
jgi:hypothetical protein